MRRPATNSPSGKPLPNTGLVEVAPNRLLLVYDRDPEGPPAGPHDVSRLFILPIEVER